MPDSIAEGGREGKEWKGMGDGGWGRGVKKRNVKRKRKKKKKLCVAVQYAAAGTMFRCDRRSRSLMPSVINRLAAGWREGFPPDD